jgi:hypothetical protein
VSSQSRKKTDAEERVDKVRARGIYRNVGDLSVRLADLRNDTADAGFFKTYQALDAAVKTLGWEAAEQIERQG